MAYEPCRYAKRWPDLWDSLPDDQRRGVMSTVMASDAAEGNEPSRHLAETVAAHLRGELTVAEVADWFRVTPHEQWNGPGPA